MVAAMNALTEPLLAESFLTPPVSHPVQPEVVAALRRVVPAHCILYREEDTRPYECDGLSLYRALPMVVTLPETEEQDHTPQNKNGEIKHIPKPYRVHLNNPRYVADLLPVLHAAVPQPSPTTPNVH